MKKNWMLRAGVLMLALTLMTSCFVGGTFAKYVTSGDSTDTARVATFGVNVQATGSTFATSYETHDSSYTQANSVISNWGDNVIAPGTKGDMTSATITGTTEVAVRVSNTAEVELSEAGWKDDEDGFYCPLVVKVGETTINGINCTSQAEFAGMIENAVATYTKDVAPNTAIDMDTLDISWEWPYYYSAENDVKDTYLGTQAAGGNNSTISITVTTTVTQID